MRIGFGYDVHRLVIDRPLILGGVNIPHTHGLLGHSDADVLLHAICDALLGAACLGDIGKHFPDTDEAYKGIDSTKLLQKTGEMIAEKYTIANIDTTICAQEPKLAPYIEAMQQKISNLLHLEPSQVSIKATTTEKLGFVGNKEGISAYAVTLLQEI